MRFDSSQAQFFTVRPFCSFTDSHLWQFVVEVGLKTLGVKNTTCKADRAGGKAHAYTIHAHLLQSISHMGAMTSALTPPNSKCVAVFSSVPNRPQCTAPYPKEDLVGSYFSACQCTSNGSPSQCPQSFQDARYPRIRHKAGQRKASSKFQVLPRVHPQP